MKKDQQPLKFVEALLQSGATLQYRLAEILNKNEWNVEVERAYSDDIEGKVRRADIVATKPIDGQLAIKLIVECKYYKNGHIVFIRENTSKPDYRKDLVSFFNLVPNQIKQYINEHGQAHRYYTNRSLSYTSLIAKATGGYQLDDEAIYKGIEQALKPCFNRSNHNTALNLTYPIVVIGGGAELYTCSTESLVGLDPSEANIPQCLNRVKKTCLEVSYSRDPYENPTRYIVDVVSFEIFKDFLEDIEKELQIYRNLQIRDREFNSMRRQQTSKIKPAYF